MGRILDWITGRKDLAEADRIDAAWKAQAHEAAVNQRQAREMATKQATARDFVQQQHAALAPAAKPQEIQRTEGKARPGEAWLPSEAARMQDMHDNPRITIPTPEPEPEQKAREATRMAYTATTQPRANMGGLGQTFVNPRAGKRSVWTAEMAQAEKDVAAELARPKHENDHDNKRDPTDTGGRKR